MGWDQITQGLVHLGFALMETYGPKTCFGKVVDVPAVAGRLTASQQACRLGVRLLQETFKSHDVVRGAIMEQLLNHIVTQTTSPVTHYLGQFI